MLEERAFFLDRHRGSAGRLSALVEETCKHQAQLVDIRGLGNLRIALQPLLGRCIPTPAGQICGDVDLLPFRMMTGLKQRLESGEEHIDEIRDIAVPLGNQPQFCDGEYAADRDRSDWLVLPYESGVIRRGQSGG